MSRTFHARKLRTKKSNGRVLGRILRAAQLRQGVGCRCWYCIGSKAYEHKNNPPMPDPYELEGLQDEIEDERMDGDYMRCWGCEAEPMCTPCESAQWLWAHPSQELAATIQEHAAYRWTGRPLPFARQHRNNWRRHLTKRFLASRYFRSKRHMEVFRNFILDLTRKPLTRR